MRHILALCALALAVSACDGDSTDGFDPALDCDLALVAGAPAQLNDGKATDRNGDGLVVLCFDPAAAAQLFPG